MDNVQPASKDTSSIKRQERVRKKKLLSFSQSQTLRMKFLLKLPVRPNLTFKTATSTMLTETASNAQKSFTFQATNACKSTTSVKDGTNIMGSALTALWAIACWKN